MFTEACASANIDYYSQIPFWALRISVQKGFQHLLSVKIRTYNFVRKKTDIIIFKIWYNSFYKIRKDFVDLKILFIIFWIIYKRYLLSSLKLFCLDKFFRLLFSSNPCYPFELPKRLNNIPLILWLQELH